MNNDTVMVRIRRMGEQWATCGIGIRPPESETRNPSMKGRCAKLVPGQVVELPRGHSILRNSKLVEIVDEPAEDEFLRPWVFSSIEAAHQADPSLSHMSAENIASALALTEGAAHKQRQALVEREESARETDMPFPAYNVGDVPISYASTTRVKRRGNRS
jgi:hypothetical protein